MTEAELAAENVAQVIDDAEDDDHAQELLAAYEHLLSDPERLKALADELARESSEERLAMGREQLIRRVRRLAREKYGRGE
jgi:hypothetical protein